VEFLDRLGDYKIFNTNSHSWSQWTVSTCRNLEEAYGLRQCEHWIALQSKHWTHLQAFSSVTIWAAAILRNAPTYARLDLFHSIIRSSKPM
jgi:hypothetical protein